MENIKLISKIQRNFMFPLSFESISFRAGTQQPIPLLKLLFERGGMYGRDKDLGWKKLKDVVYYAAMGIPEGGRHEMDPRFLSLFAIFNIIPPKDETIIYIYQSILKGHLSDFDVELLPVAEKLVTATINLFNVNTFSIECEQRLWKGTAWPSSYPFITIPS